MQPCVHDQPDRAPQFRTQPPEVRIWVLIRARNFLGKTLRIQAPPFRVGTVELLGLEFRYAGQFLCDGDLHVMAWQAFVIGDHLQHVLRHRAHVGQVGVIDPRPRSVGRARIVMLRPAVLLAERLHPPHFEPGLGQQTEILGQLGFDVVQRRRRSVDVHLCAFVALREVIVLVFLDVGEERLEIAVEAHLVLDRFHFGMNALHIVQTDLVHLLRGQIGGRAVRQTMGVIPVPIGQHPDADTDFGGIGAVCGHERDQPVVACLVPALQRSFELALHRFAIGSGDRASFDQSGDLLLAVLPQCVVGSIIERRTGNQLLRFVDHEVIREIGRTYASGCTGFRDVDQLAQSTPDFRHARNIIAHVLRRIHAVLRNQ